MSTPDIGKVGVWLGGAAATTEAAQLVERLGYGALWIGGSPSGDLEQVRQLLDATSTLPIATGIINVWASPAQQTADAFLALTPADQRRTLIGVGVGHREATEEYRSPYDTLAQYVEDLRSAGVPQENIVLAALGPRVLRLSRDRAAGAHPYFVPPEHTRRAREILGEGVLLAPEHKVYVESDPELAREAVRKTVRYYLRLANYRNNLKRLGFSDDDVAGSGSDAVVDAVVAHGDVQQVAAQVTAHLDAGADHVCIQPLGEDVAGQLQALAPALPLAR